MADFTKQHVANLFAHLKLLNVHSFEIEFDGSGDDGQIDEITFYDSGNNIIQIPEDSISWVYTDYGMGNGEPKETQVTLLKACADLGYDMLNESGHDWYNNEGGYGKIDIQIEDSDGKPKVDMDMNIRIMDTDNYHYSNVSFTMFADEGEHEKTKHRQVMDKITGEA